MSSSAVRRRATYADIEAAPENMTAEIIDGELVLSPRPASPHAAAGIGLGHFLTGPFGFGKGGPGGWVILYEPELHLAEDVLVPDWAGWRRTRMPELPNTAGFKMAPDWLAEILSPSTTARDRADKMRIYAREGVGHVWLVDPVQKTLEDYRLEQGRWMLVNTWRGEPVIRAEPFDAIELEMGLLWWK